MKTALEIMKIMNQIEYGFKDKNNINLINTEAWNNFGSFYYLLSPEELLNKKCGVCWDQVELERKLFLDKKIPCDTYFIYIDDGESLPSHTFLVFIDNKKYYWFEHSWFSEKGIHEYNSLDELLNDVIPKFIKSRKDEIKENYDLYLYKYQKPSYHITCDEFYKYLETQERILI